MFAPSVFTFQVFTPSLFPPAGAAAVPASKPPGGVKSKRYWRFEEGLNESITVEELYSREDRIVLQAYLDRLREARREESKRQKDKRIAKGIRLVASETKTREAKENDFIILATILDLI